MPDEHGRYPLHYAIEAGELGIAKLRVDRGADVDAGSPYHQPMWTAIQQGDSDAVRFLIEHHASLKRVATFSDNGRILPGDMAAFAQRTNHPDIPELLQQAE